MAVCSWNMSEAQKARQLRTSAKVRIPMPDSDAYMYGLGFTGDVDDERDSDAERVVITVVSRTTEMICARSTTGKRDFRQNYCTVLSNGLLIPHTFYSSLTQTDHSASR